MAYNPKNLNVIAHANDFTLWHYTTIDSANQVDTYAYFNDGADMLRRGDMILANVDTNEAPAAGVLVVSSNLNGIVTVADLAPFVTLAAAEE